MICKLIMVSWFWLNPCEVSSVQYHEIEGVCVFYSRNRVQMGQTETDRAGCNVLAHEVNAGRP